MAGHVRLGLGSALGSGLGIALLWPAAVNAQASVPVPQQGNPVPTREVVTPPTPTAAPPPRVSVDARGAVAQSTCPFEDSDIRLTLSAVRFTRPDGTPLQPAIADTLARVDTPTGEQSIRVVCDLRDRANAALRRDGWVASVQIPPQSIETGELQLQVVTARITEIRVRGTPGPYRDALEGRLTQLRGLDPLNQRDAERALLLAGDIPGLDVQLSLRPAGTQPGDVIGDLLVSYRPFAVLANVQNYNSRALGRETAYVRGELYGLTGLQDLLYVGASTTADFDEQKIVQAGIMFGLGGRGISLGPRIVYAWSRPDLEGIDLETKTLITGFDITAPLLRTLNTNARASVGFDYVDQITTVSTSTANSTPLNEDKLRVLFGRLSGDLTGRRSDGTVYYSLRGGLELRKGLGIFDATPVGSFGGAGAIPSRVDGNSRATVVRGDLDVLVSAGRIFSIAGSARGQWTRSALLNYEEFSLGNLTIGRGYDPGANSGDRAIGVRGELLARLPIRSSLIETQLFGFYDAVYLTNLDRNSTEVDRRLRSYGGGARFLINNQLQLEAIYARPLDRALTIDKGRPTDRFLVSLTARFDARAR